MNGTYCQKDGGSPLAVDPQPQVTAAVEQLAVATATLATMICDLEARLTPVLNAAKDVPSQCTETRQADTPVAREILEVVGRVDSTRSLVYSILCRLEV